MNRLIVLSTFDVHLQITIAADKIMYEKIHVSYSKESNDRFPYMIMSMDISILFMKRIRSTTC